MTEVWTHCCGPVKGPEERHKLRITWNKNIEWKYKNSKKQLPMTATPMTKQFWQIHPIKPKHNCIVWNKLPQALASMSMHTKLNTCAFNQTGDISTLDGSSLKLVDKFTYLGSSVSSTEKDIDTRLTKAWTAIDKLSIIWKSDLTDKMKRSFFQAVVILTLLYRCTTWMKTIQVRRTRHARHCWRSRDELMNDVLQWTPTYGRAKAGWPARTYIQQLCEDMGCSPEDMPEVMNDREKWRERARDISAGSTTWWWWWW